MRIKIINNRSVDWWYYDKVGESFDVEKEYAGYYSVRINKTKIASVFKSDCQVVNTNERRVC
jgi:hypothetical protein